MNERWTKQTFEITQLSSFCISQMTSERRREQVTTKQSNKQWHTVCTSQMNDE